jgi:SagB-type dehydrogenase family enzyme
MAAIDDHRFFLKDTIRLQIDFSATDQHTGRPAPPVQKPHDTSASLVRLPEKDEWEPRIGGVGLKEAIANRESRRRFTGETVSMEELSFLLWATQGIRREYGGGTALRTVPSAGARHSFETYLFVFDVDGLEEGLYRYLPREHALLPLPEAAGEAGGAAGGRLREALISAALYQDFVGRSAVTFVWTTVPYRMEWRYSLAAHRVILIDAGHVCQNLYLACEAIGAGTCAIAAYHQEEMDALIGVDGKDEFTVYLGPVGKV